MPDSIATLPTNAAPPPPIVPIVPVVSPTGTPVLSPKLTPYVFYLMALASAVSMAPDVGLELPDVLLKIDHLVLLAAPLFGIASPGWRKALPVLLAVLGLSLAACATTSTTSAAAPVNVATSSLDATGKLFLTTAAALDAAYDAKLISELQYQPWRDFSLRFKAAYAIADKALAAAAQSNDQTVQGVVQAEMDTLSRELGTFQALAAQVAHPTTGPPAGFQPVPRPLRLLAAGGEL